VKVFHKLGFKASLGTFPVGIFNAQDEVAAGAAREEPIVERGARIPDVEQAGGGRSETDADFWGIHDSNDDSPWRGVSRYANGSDAERDRTPNLPIQVKAMASDAIQSVTIEGFKSIRSIKDLPLRPINILIGANGSGKTNFLDAFVFLGTAHLGDLESYTAYYGGANKLLFLGSKTTQRIYVSIKSANGLDLSADCRYTVADSLYGTISSGWNDRYGPTFNRYRFHDTGENSPFKKTSELDNNRALSRFGGNLAAYLYRLKQQHRDSYELIRKTVQQVAPFFHDFRLEPLALNPNTIKLEWQHLGTDDYFDVSSFSDGTLRFIALATLFLQPSELRASLILVDEPELGLHPYAIGLLASLIRQASKDGQVIVATQSPLLVDYFEPEDVLVADRVDGATQIRRLERAPLAEWLTDYSLGQLWEKGELEGRPVPE
jgi:predicted ATPase